MDKRTLQEIYDGFGPYDRACLVLTLAKRCKVARPTASNWCNGRRTPYPPSARRIVKALKTVYDIKTDADTLFPQRVERVRRRAVAL